MNNVVQVAVELTLKLLTHLKEYLHFLDFHLPLPQLFLPGAFAVLVGVSGRSALVPLSTLTASSCTQVTISVYINPLIFEGYRLQNLKCNVISFIVY